MRNREDAFHLAIPCRDLEEARRFYTEILGCRPARRYEDRITLDFFGDQLVCHLAPEKIDADPQMYPRHFGIAFKSREDFDALLARARERDAPFFAEPCVRFPGRREEHETFFLRDPSNNLLEFKWYRDAAMMH